MKSIIKSAKTLEEAVELGLKELGLDRSNTDIEIIQEPTKGFLGMFGGSDAVVKIKEKETSNNINLDEIFGDLTKDTSFEEKLDEETDLDEEIDERFNKYDDEDFDDVDETEEVFESEEVEEEIEPEVENSYEVEEDANKEDSFQDEDEQFAPADASEEDDFYEDSTETEDFEIDDSDFYEESISKEDDIQEVKKNFDESYEEDGYDDFEEDDQNYEVFKSDKDQTINTRELTFSGEANTISDDDSLEVAAEKTKKLLEDILIKMHIEAKVNYQTRKNNIINLDLTDISENDTGIVIGSKGETLNAIQYTLSLLANRNTKQFYRITLNVADYRQRRKKSIENNAKKVAFKVLKTKKSIALKPMNSYERRIVHYSLQSYKELETVSSGKFPNRKVVVKFKG